MIIGIESSCDETAIAAWSTEQGIVYEQVISQLAVHQEYGGVVPALASREHLNAISPLVEDLLKHIDSTSIEAIAVTRGPGLAGCLALGIGAAKALGLALNVPVIGVNHLRGHAFSPFIPPFEETPSSFKDTLANHLPHLGLIASGGNTLLFKLDQGYDITILAETLDDAAGEALDKGAKLLGMPYPGGRLIEAQAKSGDFTKYPFPRAFESRYEMKFSFSGLKTSLKYLLEKMERELINNELNHLCASYQEAVMGALSKKVKQALQTNTYRSIGLSGGVANNGRLQELMVNIGEDANIPLLRAKPKHTGDNAAMIAFAGALEKSVELEMDPSLRLDQI